MDTPHTNRLSGNSWLQLLRVPNLLTVPGDPLAGGLLAMAAGAGGAGTLRFAAAAGASLLLYSGGLVQNDYFDLAEDRVERPNRPLPSGKINPKTAIFVAFALAVGGVCLAGAASVASGAAAAAVLVAMTLYNAGLKRIHIVGPIFMGVCRGLSLMIGAGLFGWAACGEPAVILSAAGLAAFIAAVTAIASRETQTVRVGLLRWLPAAVVAAWLGGLTVLLPEQLWISVPTAALAVLWVIYCVLPLKGTPAPAVVQKTIGRLIGGLLPIQAAVAVHAIPAGLFVAAALVPAWPAARLLAKRFYAS